MLIFLEFMVSLIFLSTFLSLNIFELKKWSILNVIINFHKKWERNQKEMMLMKLIHISDVYA